MRILRMALFCVALAFALGSAVAAQAQDSVAVRLHNQELNKDTVINAKVMFETESKYFLSLGDSVLVMPKAKKNLLTKFMDYLLDTNTDYGKKFRFSLLGGPSYDSETKLGLAILGNGTFRLNGCSLDSQPSNATLTGRISTSGFWSVGIDGNLFFPEDKMRAYYSLEFDHYPTKFWGIGYRNGNEDSNEVSMDRNELTLDANFMFRLFPHFFAGPKINWTYVNVDSIARMELLNGQKLYSRSYGAGITMSYDTRDNTLDASSGVYVELDQMFFPKFFGNTAAFARTSVKACYYHSLWRGAHVAGEVKGDFNYGKPAWTMLAKLGGSHEMRGYYPGRYRDNNMLMAQVELRQKIWYKLGCVAWGGVGSVFKDGKVLDHVLPNYGFGMRWEFRKKMNVRFDYGFGRKGQSAFSLGLYEAF